MSVFNSGFWAHQFKNVFQKHIVAFREAVLNRLLPTFEEIDKEAEAVSIQEWENPSIDFDPEYFDEGDLAARAEEAGMDHYFTLQSIEQTILNLSISALHHIFEQQLLLFHRREVLPIGQEHEKNLLNIPELKKRLTEKNINLEELSTWPKLNELRLAANTIKHAEGKSADELRALRTDVFTHPSVGTIPELSKYTSSKIYMPLSGEDIFFTQDDIKNYCSSILLFWDEFGEALQNAE